jgi:hypothetical protein
MNRKRTAHLDPFTFSTCARLGCNRRFTASRNTKKYCSDACRMQVSRGKRKKDLTKRCQFCMTPGADICPLCKELKFEIGTLTPEKLSARVGLMYQAGIPPFIRDQHRRLLPEDKALAAINMWLLETARYFRVMYLLAQQEEADLTAAPLPTTPI